MENLFILALNKKDLYKDLDSLDKAGIANRKNLHGCYKGKVERSYLVKASGPEVQKLAVETGQESYIRLGKMHPNLGREAVLVYTDSGKEVNLGHLTRVSKDKAWDQDAWTYDIKENNYYICK